MKKAVPLFLVLVAGLYIVCLRAYYVGFFNDDAFYVIGARSLLQGNYVELNHPGKIPLSYFPGYPLLLTPLCAIFPDSLFVLQILSVVFVLVGLWGQKRLFQNEMDPFMVIISVVLVSLSPLTISLSGTILSELPLFALTPLIFHLVHRHWEKLELKPMLAITAIASYAAWVRPTGITFMAALILGLLFEKRWKSAGQLLLLFILFFSLWVLRNLALQGTMSVYFGEYHSSFSLINLSAALSNVWANAVYYTDALFVKNMFRLDAIGILIQIAGLIVLAAGMHHWGTQGWRKTILLHTALQLLIYLGWGKQAARYLLPLFPLVFPLFFLGITDLTRDNTKARQVAGALVVTALVLFFKPIKNIIITSLYKHTTLNTPPERTYAWVRNNTSMNDICAVELDGRFYLHTGRPALLLKYVLAPEVRYALLFPTDFIMRPANKQTTYDFTDPLKVRNALIQTGFQLVFKDEQEGSEIYSRGR